MGEILGRDEFIAEHQDEPMNPTRWWLSDSKHMDFFEAIHSLDQSSHKFW